MHLHDLVLGALLKKDEAIIEGRWEAGNISPDVERGDGLVLDSDSHFRQFLQEKVALLFEKTLECPGVSTDEIEIHQRQNETLKRSIGATIQVRSGTTQHLHEGRRRHYPAAAEARAPPILREPINDEDRVLVDVLNVRCTRDSLGPIGVVVGTSIEDACVGT